jgi:hypothetical protein
VLSLKFDDCSKNIKVSAITTPSDILIQQAVCGKLTGVHLDFTDERDFFDAVRVFKEIYEGIVNQSNDKLDL